MIPDDITAPGRIEIDLGALVRNFRRLQERAAPAECGATVKANAYGHGIELVVPALLQAGCQTFFIATPREGERVRALAPDATIYVLDGLLPGASDFYLKHQLKPIIGDLFEFAEWFAATKQPAALHIDTGLNRSGLSPKEVEVLASTPDVRNAGNIDLIVSHLACGDDPDNPMNAQQSEAFEAVRKLFPDTPASFSNSAALVSGRQNHFDLARPGISLYGGRAVEEQANPMEPVARVFARILKIRDNWSSASVGYGATRSLQSSTRLATLAIGYGDGLSRHLSAGDGEAEAHVLCAGQRVPIVGRISMDLTTIDISSLPDGAANRGDLVEIFGQNIDVDEMAERAGTMGYELLTQLSTRFPRIAVTSDEDS